MGFVAFWASTKPINSLPIQQLVLPLPSLSARGPERPWRSRAAKAMAAWGGVGWRVPVPTWSVDSSVTKPPGGFTLGTRIIPSHESGAMSSVEPLSRTRC